jgi:hypothetical protein
MNGCPSRHHLEAAVLGEAHDGYLHELDAHASGCARCRHELNWVRTETALFAQRAARQEVSRLWEGIEHDTAPRRRTVARGLLALVASIALAAIASGRLGSTVGRGADRGDNLPMSLEMMSVDRQLAAVELASMPCYTPGFGIACGPAR